LPRHLALPDDDSNPALSNVSTLKPGSTGTANGTKVLTVARVSAHSAAATS